MAIRRLGNGVALLAALAVMGLPWSQVGRKLANARPVPASPVRPSAVVWSGRVFPSQPELRVWLHARGASYSLWARRHPKAHGNLTRRR